MCKCDKTARFLCISEWILPVGISWSLLKDGYDLRQMKEKSLSDLEKNIIQNFRNTDLLREPEVREISHFRKGYNQSPSASKSVGSGNEGRLCHSHLWNENKHKHKNLFKNNKEKNQRNTRCAVR